VDRYDLVFTNEVGAPVEPTGFYQRQFLPLLKKAGLPRVTFHQLRHSVATVLLETGLHPAVASALLGYAQISKTLDVYSHVVPGLAAKGSTALRELIWGDSNELSSDLSSNDERENQEEKASSSVN
jgi:integrase